MASPTPLPAQQPAKCPPSIETAVECKIAGSQLAPSMRPWSCFGFTAAALGLKAGLIALHPRPWSRRFRVAHGSGGTALGPSLDSGGGWSLDEEPWGGRQSRRGLSWWIGERCLIVMHRMKRWDDSEECMGGSVSYRSKALSMNILFRWVTGPNPA